MHSACVVCGRWSRRWAGSSASNHPLRCLSAWCQRSATLTLITTLRQISTTRIRCVRPPTDRPAAAAWSSGLVHDRLPSVTTLSFVRPPARTDGQTTAIFNLVGGGDGRTDAWRKHNRSPALRARARPAFARFQRPAVNLTTSAARRLHALHRRYCVRPSVRTYVRGRCLIAGRILAWRRPQ